ncbi:SPW repeat protein [Actinocrinis puniceicyclus]|uniref:SPW repeat protein n=1 Tax=Actinocrinis puniceicyclus TaxID=977794 RepID=A0A8J7WLL5_9ACTN|nr:SPW repeat protein [Actinocrinis puniceicyclus]MBS2964621.1 SPW repeat protein [Actinocrinis puniceicyclus]
MTTPTSQPRIEQHPDLLEMRARFERATTTPTVQGAEALGILTGLYLAASPWIAGFNGLSTLAVNNLITGIGFALLMAGFGSAYQRTHAMAWAATVIGLWTVISPWAVAGSVHTTRTITSNCITGGVATLLGLVVVGTAMKGRSRMRAADRTRRHPAG